MPLGRLIRIERGSLLRLRGEPEVPPQELPRWVTLKQAGDYYQVSPNLIRRIIAHERLDGSPHRQSRSIRIDRESLLGHVMTRRYITIAEAAEKKLLCRSVTAPCAD